MTKCPYCDSPLEYNQAAGIYYCPKCQKHWEPIEAEQRETMYQDTTTGNEPIDQKELEEEAQKARNK